MKQGKHAPKYAPYPAKPKWLVVGLFVVLLVAAMYFVIDRPYRQRFSAVFNEVERVRTEAITPLGGIEWTSGTYAPKFDGDGLIASLACIDVLCPSVSRSWFVPVVKDQDEKFVHDLMDASGYQQKNDYAGIAGNFEINISVNSADSINARPKQVVQDKEWRLIQLSVYLSK